MIIQHKIKTDLVRKGSDPIIHLTQGDTGLHRIQFCITCDHKPWSPPDGLTVLIHYSNSFGSGGSYDTLPDGSRAAAINRSSIEVSLVPEVSALPGSVRIVVTLIQGGKALSALSVQAMVAPLASATAPVLTNYSKITGFLPIPDTARAGQYLTVESVDQNGKITGIAAAAPPEIPQGSGSSVELEENDLGVLIHVSGNGTETSAQVRHGRDGSSVTVDALTESTADGGINTVTFSDGTTLTIRNGMKGKDGSNGADGKNGIDGKDGITPIKGVDYWTDADKSAIVQEVITALGTPVFGTVDAENTIILTGNLADGTYTLKYEDAEGNQSEIGNVVIGGGSPEPAYINQIPISIDSDGSVYNGKGYKESTRISSSSGSISSNDAVDLTGFIPVGMDNIIRMKNVDFKWATIGSNGGLHFYAEDKKTKIVSVNSSNYNETTITNTLACQYDEDGDLIQFTTKFIGTATTPYAWMRVCASNITDESIITVNQEIV